MNNTVFVLMAKDPNGNAFPHSVHSSLDKVENLINDFKEYDKSNNKKGWVYYFVEFTVR